jgi:hypothetical protein
MLKGKDSVEIVIGVIDTSTLKPTGQDYHEPVQIESSVGNEVEKQIEELLMQRRERFEVKGVACGYNLAYALHKLCTK